MNLILLSIFSRKSDAAGFMIYDLVRSCARYIHLVDSTEIQAKIHQIRGVSVAGNRLYAVSPSALLIFKILLSKEGPALTLEKTVRRPEWVLGGKQQGDLQAVFASLDRRKVYVSFNAQCAIDIFDLEGNFQRRQYLSGIAPDIFPLPSGIVSKRFRFGAVRHIFESHDNQLLITISLMNGTNDSSVISCDTGRVFIRKSSQPINGGVLHKDILYVCAVRNAEVLAYPWHNENGKIIEKPVRKFRPRLTDSKWEGSDQKTRGLYVNDNRLLCGVSYFGKPIPKQIPPRLVEFDLLSGKQIREHWLPSFKAFKEPHIYGMVPVVGDLKKAMAFRDRLELYRGESLLSPNQSALIEPVEIAGKTSFIETEKKLKPVFITDGSDVPGKKAAPQFEAESIIEKGNSAEKTLPKPPVVIFENVGLCFERAAQRFLSFKKNLREKKAFWALCDISFAVGEGETLGIIGRNGSGKSTLAMICSGVLVPDQGKVTVQGRSQLLALGVGFKPELSGRENVFISGSLLGLSKKELKGRMDEIEEFAELGEFIDEPMRTYSSGMKSRLGFAVATAVKPDVLILDEVMSTGDKAFRAKAMKRMNDMRGMARSVIVVSHNPGQLRKLSNRVLWLEKGRMLMLGQPKEVLNAYDNFCKNPAKWFKKHPEAACKFTDGKRGYD